MTEPTNARENLGATRLLIGLAQGVALFALHTWPAHDSWLFAALSLAVTYVPVTALVGVGQLRPATFTGWIVASVGLIAFTTWHAVAREVGAYDSVLLDFALSPILFVAYHLIAAADADGRFPASYRSYFDIGWKNGVQLALSLAFVGTFWLLLLLGASLFELINIKVVQQIIAEDVFAFPATATVFALAVHVTDVRVALINGIRNVSLVLLSWLLPLMTLLVVAFLGTLGATGLEPLWATKHATPILLIAGGALVVLINAAYQDGDAAPHWLLQLAARIAGLALLPLGVLAFYSVWLRVEQHGLSPDRVVALAVLAVAACYATGYTTAAAWPGRWLKPLELTNILAALVAVALGVALLTPLADPARLAVDDQVRRLRAGLITPEAFDFNFLRFEAARYGREALEALARDKSSPRAQQIAEKAQASLNQNAPGLAPVEEPSKVLLAKIVVRPQGGKLPESFINQDWSQETPLPTACPSAHLPNIGECRAYMLDIDGDGAAEVVVNILSELEVYRLKDGVWRSIGSFPLNPCYVPVAAALESGRFQLVPVKERELEINGIRVHLQQRDCR